MDIDEQNLEVQEEKNSTNKIFSKNLIIIISILLIAIIFAFIFEFFVRSPKATVKEYVKAIEKYDTDKLVNLMDPAGSIAFYKCANDLSKFDSFFETETKQMSDSERNSVTSSSKDILDSVQGAFGLVKLMNVKISAENIKTEKVPNSKRLTKVTCNIVTKSSNGKVEKSATFYTVKKGLKNYIVSVE